MDNVDSNDGFDFEDTPDVGMTPPDVGNEPDFDMDDSEIGGGHGMDEPDMEDHDVNMPEEDGDDNDELMDVVNGLSMEDKVAVLKYAKSLGDDNIGDDKEMQFNESVKRKRDDIINEIMNDIFNRRDGEKTTKREPKEIENDRITKNNPFVGNR